MRRIDMMRAMSLLAYTVFSPAETFTFQQCTSLSLCSISRFSCQRYLAESQEDPESVQPADTCCSSSIPETENPNQSTDVVATTEGMSKTGLLAGPRFLKKRVGKLFLRPNQKMTNTLDRRHTSLSRFPYNYRGGHNDKETDAYHLLWSPHMRNKFACTTAILVIVPRFLAWIAGTKSLTEGFVTTTNCHNTAVVGWSIWNNLVVPLVASACCLIQLALNVLAIGCAGWNKVLGPMRPHFMALLVVTGAQQKLHSSSFWQWFLAYAARISVAMLPEALDWCNQRHVMNTSLLKQEQPQKETMEHLSSDGNGQKPFAQENRSSK